MMVRLFSRDAVAKSPCTCGSLPGIYNDINWAEVDGDLLMIATIQAPQGVTNLLQQVFLGQILINDNQ